jgi:hypothetical protein
MAASPSPPPGSPLVWLLLSNALFWGALFGGEALLQRAGQRSQAQPPAAGPASDMAANGMAELLQANPLRQAGPAAPTTRLAASPIPAPLGVPAAPATADTATPWAGPVAPEPPGLGREGEPGRLARQLQGADALGGAVTLASLGEPRMVPAARAEQLGWQRSGDPLSPLPLHWQNRLRQETAGGPPIQRAELVHLPVGQLQQREEVAVLIDDSGVAQGLDEPRQQPVREAVEDWASRQAPAEAGGLHAVVIAAEPLPPAPEAEAGPVAP